MILAGLAIRYDGKLSHLFIFYFRFDGQNLTTYFPTEHSHGYTYGLASYNGQPFITGSYNEHSKTEMMNFKKMRWTTVPDYPFRS